MNTRHFLKALGLGLLLTAGAAPVMAQGAYPSRPVKMVVPFPAGSATDLAARIIRHSPLAIGGVITAVTRGLNMAIDEGLQTESEQFARLVPSHDLGEGLAAWIARRRPVYSGR